MLGLRCCTWAFSICSEQGLLFAAVCGAPHGSGPSRCGAWSLGMRASAVAAQGLSSCGSWALECRLSSCGARPQLLHGMRDLPRRGLEPMSPALAGRLPITAPPGKSLCSLFNWIVLCCWVIGVLCILWLLNSHQTYNLQIFYPILYIVFSLSW